MPRHPRRRLAWVLAGIALFLGLLVWGVPRTGTLEERSRDVRGTSGRVATDVPEGDPEGGSAGIAGGIRELQTRTGVEDELVGRRVTFEVDLAEHPSLLGNGQRFWTGGEDNPLLVVLARDVDPNAPHERGEPREHAIPRIEPGMTYTVSGIIEAVPPPEARFSWNLSDWDQRLLARRSIYVRADRVTPAS